MRESTEYTRWSLLTTVPAIVGHGAGKHYQHAGADRTLRLARTAVGQKRSFARAVAQTLPDN